MLVLPVIDLQAGAAVHGRAGKRAAYRPIESVLSPSSDPLELARGIIDRLGLLQVYLADLDAIGGGQPAWHIYQNLVELGFQLWLDAGVARFGTGNSIR